MSNEKYLMALRWLIDNAYINVASDRVMMSDGGCGCCVEYEDVPTEIADVLRETVLGNAEAKDGKQ
jgi:hypothetical protein